MSIALVKLWDCLVKYSTAGYLTFMKAYYDCSPKNFVGDEKKNVSTIISAINYYKLL